MSGVRIDAGVAEREVRIELDLPEGAITAVVGPNGSGKSTLLQLIAGLVRPSEGQVRLGSRIVSGPGRFVAPHRRKAVLLTQQTALFPHLDVLHNVAFGPRSVGVGRREAKLRAEAELAAVGCLELGSRRAHELSGGQAQRVAIARALATDPEIVLLDEPMAGLDVAAATEVRHHLAERLRGRTALLVTHEVLDLWTIADQIVALAAGRVVEVGPKSLLTRPTSAFVAQLGGVNLFSGIAVEADLLELAPGVQLRGLSDPAQPPRAGSRALAAIEPAAISLHLTSPGGSPRNHLAVQVVAIEPRGAVVRIQLQTAEQRFAADLTAAAVAELGLTPGADLWAVVKATQVRLYGS